MNKEQKDALTKSIVESIENGEITLDEARKVVNDTLKKAVRSDSAPAENGPENDSQLNGENKPTLQDAKSPSDLETESKVKEQDVPENIDANQAKGGQVSFGDFFSDAPYSLGSTLEQSPEGNVISNIKKPSMDYVERAKNHKNLAVDQKPEENIEKPHKE